MYKEIKYYDEVKKDRAKFRKLPRDIKERIAFLRKVLRGRELSAVS